MPQAPHAPSADALTAVAMRQLRPGTVVDGKFVIREFIARGGMGLALRAWEQEWERDCVIKMLAPHMHERFNANGCAAMLQTEAKTLSLLARSDSTSFVQVYGRGTVRLALDAEDGGGELELPYYAMELLHGSTLQRMLRKKRAAKERSFIDWNMVVTMALKIAEALSVAHALGRVHRDLKPDNIYVHLLAHRFDIKVIDWGISTVDGEPVRGGTGTERYAAPELLQSARSGAESVLSDIYPLGLVFYEIAALRGPFEVPKGAFARAHLREIPPPLSEFRADAPPRLVALLAAMLEKEPTKRPNAAAVVATLREVQKGLPDDSADPGIRDLLPPAAPPRSAQNNQSGIGTFPVGFGGGATGRNDSFTAPLISEKVAPLYLERPPAPALPTAPLPATAARTPVKYADTEPDAEPFGATVSIVATAPLGLPAEASAPLRVFKSTAEMFDAFWDDDTKYTTSPLETKEAASAEPTQPPMIRPPVIQSAVIQSAAGTEVDLVASDVPLETSELRAAGVPVRSKAQKAAVWILALAVAIWMLGISIQGVRLMRHRSTGPRSSVAAAQPPGEMTPVARSAATIRALSSDDAGEPRESTASAPQLATIPSAANSERTATKHEDRRSHGIVRILPPDFADAGTAAMPAITRPRSADGGLDDLNLDISH
jgi:serine/threonine protein kinase